MKSAAPLSDRRPGVKDLGIQIAIQAYVFYQAARAVSPMIADRFDQAYVIVGLAVMVFWMSAGALRHLDPAPALHRDLPVLQRVAMGDADDEALRRSQTKQAFQRQWLNLPWFWGATGLLSALLALPWPLDRIPGMDAEMRFRILIALHIAAGVMAVWLWQRARDRVADA